ncbi:hypothetical protein GCM10009630_41920 [Kribbella jejuensis]|uniref:Uncharacterized protein n=1 Tax=Kribbella jejuensis TaxID=236068 RepID=A0A542EQY3_9ACTN|nr:hypothetical protein [Kribbella jejuensis]TQJ17586.1 hypothetical protein FB475_1707 [Kribbella jejuensis]
MADEISDEERDAQLNDHRTPQDAADLVARFTGSDFQPPASSLHGNYKQLADAGVPPAAIAAKIRAQEAKAAEDRKGNSR